MARLGRAFRIQPIAQPNPAIETVLFNQPSTLTPSTTDTGTLVGTDTAQIVIVEPTKHLLRQTFENGANGALVTTTTSRGGGDSFSLISDTGSALTYDTSRSVNGTRSMHINATTNAYTRWDAFQIGETPPTTFYFRLYLWMDANPSTTRRIAAFYDNTNTLVFGLNISTGGKVQSYDAANTSMGLSTTSISLGQWVRIEGKVFTNATTGTVDMRLYNSPQSATATETWAYTARNTGPHFDEVRWGNTAAVTQEMWMDDIAMSFDDWIGQTAYAGTVLSRVAGGLTATQFSVTFHTLGVTNARMGYTTDSTFATGVTYTSYQNTGTNGFTKFTTGTLSANTQYYYFLEDNLGQRYYDKNSKGAVKTPNAAGTATNFTVHLGSCITSGSAGEALYHSASRSTRPAFWLNMGDIHYEDIGTNDQNLARTAMRVAMEKQAIRASLRDTALVYMPDDHDYSGNNIDGTAPGIPAVQATVREMFPTYTLPVSDSLEHAFTIGRIRFIILDVRAHRSDPAATDNSSKTMLGTTQKAWLKSELLNATEPVKVVMSGMVWHGTTTTDDTWAKYSTERTELLNYISSNNITGLYFVSGDSHFLAADNGTNAPGGFPAIQVAPVNNSATVRGGSTWSQGAYPTAADAATYKQYGILDFTDDGTTVTIDFTGYDYVNNINRITMSTSVGGSTNKSASDTGTLSATESASILVTSTITDTGTIVGTDTASVQVVTSATDTGTISVTDNMTLLATVPTTDTGTVVGTDSVASTSITMSTTDSGTIVGSDVGTLGTIVTSASDTGTLALTESVTTNVSFSTTDTGAVVGTDSSATFVPISASDSGTISLSESVTVRKGPVVKSSASNNSGTGASSATNVTLPSGINTGDVAYMVVEANTATDRGDPSGWTLLDFTSSSTVLQQKVYRKSLASSDSGTNVSWTLTNSQKWSIGVVIVENDGGVDVQETAVASGTASSTWGTSATTPVTADDLILAFHSWRVNNTGTTTQTAPTGYSEVVETSLNAAATPTFATAINQKEVTGGASVQVGATTDGGYDQSTTNRVVLVLAIKPGLDITPASASDTGTVALTESVAITATTTASDTGTISSTESYVFGTIPITAADTGTLASSESSSPVASFSTTDTGAITGTDTVTSTSVTLSTTDTGAISSSESVATSATLSTTDSGVISGSDVGTFSTVAVAASDTGAISSSESVSTRADYPGSDTGTISVSETSNVQITGTISVNASDTGTLVLAESVSTAVSLSTTDSGVVVGTDSGSISLVTITVSDSNAITGTDVGTFATVAVSASDSSTITGTDSSVIAVSISTTDTGAITGTDAAISTSITMSTTDTSAVTGTESVATRASFSTTDTGTISSSESVTTQVPISATDSGAIVSTESVATAVSTSTTDTGTISATETTAFYVTLSTTDTGAVVGTDTGSFATVSVTAADSSTISGTDSAFIFVNYPGSDSGVIVGTDTATIDISGNITVSASDTGTISGSDIASVTASFSSTDSSTVSGSDSANVFKNSTTDTGAVVGTDSSAIMVPISTSDSGTISGSDSASVVASGVSDITASDTGTLSSSETAIVVVSVTSSDTGTLNSSETAAFGTVSVAASDTSNIAAADSGAFQTPIALSATDTGTLVGTDTTVTVFNSLPGSDSGVIQGSDSATVLTVFDTKSTSDSGSISSSESVAIAARANISDTGTISSTESVGTYVTLSTTDIGQVIGTDSGTFAQIPVAASDSSSLTSSESVAVSALVQVFDSGGINGSDVSTVEIVGVVSKSASDSGVIQGSESVVVEEITQISVTGSDFSTISAIDSSSVTTVVFGEVNVEGTTGQSVSVSEGTTGGGVSVW
jgi:hypothetical protein